MVKSRGIFEARIWMARVTNEPLSRVQALAYIWHAAAADAKSLQSCPTLCNPIDRSPPDSPIPGILQARTLEWVAISFSNAWKWKVKVKSLSCVWLLGTPWTAAHQAPPSMGFSGQQYWTGVPLPSPMSDMRFPQISVLGAQTQLILWKKYGARELEWSACWVVPGIQV